MTPTSALPIGAVRTVSEMQPLHIDPSVPGSKLYNAVLGIFAPPNPDKAERYDEEILDLNILGFVVMCVVVVSGCGYEVGVWLRSRYDPQPYHVRPQLSEALSKGVFDILTLIPKTLRQLTFELNLHFLTDPKLFVDASNFDWDKLQLVPRKFKPLVRCMFAYRAQVCLRTVIG